MRLLVMYNLFFKFLNLEQSDRELGVGRNCRVHFYVHIPTGCNAYCMTKTRLAICTATEKYE